MNQNKVTAKKGQKTRWLSVLVLFLLLSTLGLLYLQINHSHPFDTALPAPMTEAPKVIENPSPSYSDAPAPINQETLIKDAKIELETIGRLDHCVKLLQKAIDFAQSTQEKEALATLVAPLLKHPYHQRLLLIQQLQNIKASIQPAQTEPSITLRTPHSEESQDTRSVIQELEDKLKKAVIIRQTKRTIQPILTDYDQNIYSNNIQFLLGLSQQGLVEMNNDLYHYGLQNAHDLLLHQGQLSEQQKQALADIESLSNLDLTLPKLDFSSLLNASNNEIPG